MLAFWRCLWRCIRRCLHAQTFDHSVLYHSNYSAVAQIPNLLSNLDHCSSHWHRQELYFNTSIFFQVQLLLLSFSTNSPHPNPLPPHLQWCHLLRQENIFLVGLLSLPEEVAHLVGRVDFLITDSVVSPSEYSSYCQVFYKWTAS